MNIPPRKFRWKVLHPRYWLQNQPKDDLWDERLNEFIDKGLPFDKEDEFNAYINGHKVWIENHPYASFTYKKFGVSRQTVIRAKLWLDECVKEAGNTHD